MSVPLKRAVVGAALSCLLAVGVMTPAAIASADDLHLDDQTTTVVDEQAPADPASEEPASEEPAPAEEAQAEEEVPTDERPVEPDTEETPDAAETTAVAPPPAAELTPTPTATSTNDPDPNRIDPGESLVVRYPVTGARIVSIWAAGDGLEVTVSRPGGGTLTIPDFGSYHQTAVWWLGMPDGEWTLTIRNIGDDTVTPSYGLTYTTAATQVGLSSSVGAPALNLNANPLVGGVGRADLELLSEVTAPDGTTYTQDLAPQAPGSTGYQTTYTGLPNGQYLARVWMEVDGVTYEESKTVTVYELETEPPVMSVGTNPAAPNAAGWFRSTIVFVELKGADSGSGYWQGYYTVDGGAEQSSYPGTTFLVTGEGEHTIAYRGRDSQGNYSEWAERPIRIDTVRPDISLHGIVEGANYEIGEEVVAEYQCTDATSGLATCVGDKPDMGRIDTSTRGSFTFAVVATDNAGNSYRVWRNYTVGPVDTTDPVVEAELPEEPASGWYTGPVTIALAASDDDTGVARVHWEYDTETGTVSGDVTTESTEFTIDRTGEFQVTYWAQDAAGNRSEGRTLNLRIDVDRPEIDIISPEGEAPSILPNGHYAQNERVVVDYSCDDLGSGVDGCVGPVAAGALLPTTTPGTHEFRVVATDLAGNRTENWVVYTVDAAPAAGGGTSGDPANTPRLAQTGAELLIPGVVLVAVLLAAGSMLLVSRRLGGR